MGPLFNGMTIASERNVWAAGMAARGYADRMPENMPRNEDDACPTPTPPEDDSGPTMPTDGQRDEIDRSNSDAKPSDEEQAAKDTIDKIKEGVDDILDEGNKITNSEDYQKFQEFINGLEDVANDLKELEKVGKAILDIIGVLDGGIPIGELVNALIDGLLDKIEGDFKKYIEEQLESLLKSEFEDLDSALESLADQFVSDPQVLNYPHPARLGDKISHGADGEYGSGAANGTITEASSNVFFGTRAVARVNDAVSCDFHADRKIAQGSATVFANGWPIARVGSKINCNGVVTTGTPGIFVDMDLSTTFKLDIYVGIEGDVLDLMTALSELFPPDELAEAGVGLLEDLVPSDSDDTSSSSDDTSSSDDEGS